MITRVDHVKIVELCLYVPRAFFRTRLLVCSLNVVNLLLAVHHLDFIVCLIHKRGILFGSSIADHGVADHPLLAAHPCIHCVVERVLHGLLLRDDVELAGANLVLLPFRLRLHVDADHLGCASAGVIVKRVHDCGDMLHSLVPVACVPRIQTRVPVQHGCHLLTSRATTTRGLVVISEELQLHLVELEARDLSGSLLARSVAVRYVLIVGLGKVKIAVVSSALVCLGDAGTVGASCCNTLVLLLGVLEVPGPLVELALGHGLGLEVLALTLHDLRVGHRLRHCRGVLGR